MHSYKHHLGDYDSHTTHLTWDEDMAYTRLLRLYYSREAPIPLDPGVIFRLVRATCRSTKCAVTRILHEFFVEQADGWHNKRADEEIAAYQAQADTNRRIARQRFVNGSSTKRIPNHKPITNNQEPDKSRPPIPPSGAFLKFWGAWPSHTRKQAKGACWLKWLRSDLDQAVDQILAHVEALKASDWKKDGGKFIPGPLVYLNQKRWEGAEPGVAPAESPMYRREGVM